MQQIIVDFGRLELFGNEIHLRIFGYGLMLVLGFILALYLACRRARRAGENPDTVTHVAILALVGGVLGARIFYVARHWHDGGYSTSDNFLADFLNVSSGGLIYFGGLAGGAIFVLSYLFIKRLSVRRFLDILAPSLMLGLAFGRMGCFCNGCCWGGPVAENWALGMKFPMVSQPILNFDGDGPYCPEQGMSPIYSDLYWQGQAMPDDRLINRYAPVTRTLEEYNKTVTRNALIPLNEYHKELAGDQLAVTFGGADKARPRFDSVAGEDMVITQKQWTAALQNPDGPLAGSEHWSEAVMFDDNGDGALDFAEFWSYIQARKGYIVAKFNPGGDGKLSPQQYEQANKYLQQNMYDILAAQRTPVRRPAQVLGIINALLLCLLLNIFYRYRRSEGQVFALMLILYPPTRFLLESVRHDDRFNLFHGSWSHNQISGWFIVAVGIIFWYALSKLSPSAGPSLAQRQAQAVKKPEKKKTSAGAKKR